ncbi:DUF3592 domain-containing protein [Terriglobus albidus]|uniref:DUF3592 domain-containing protein n=1 Tax=Terriglobus albidus TaxID=1592106 RepID=A0A5B9EGU9_9BACT|nr:DUF3592 domain-containing protein [Terriglobus albidus]QEE29286.1 DUF3592 domain-containing protein [Terriglobus albidus]
MQRLFRVTALALGSILTLIGVGLGLAEGWFLLHAEHTQAVILTVENDHPRFLFNTKQSRQYEITSAKALPGLRRGQTVAIAYRPDDPTNAQIEAGTPRWFLALLFSGLGVIVTYLGLYLSRREHENQEF